jgi:tripartite-type tricarboxylate transporter receptor subunit TctC
VPTAAEAGLPGYNVDFWYALVGPGGMPRALIDRIQRDVAAIVNAPAMKESLLAQGVIAVGGKPEELDALITREYEQWVKVVRARNVKFE